MKKNYFMTGLIVLGLCAITTSCSKDDEKKTYTEEEAQNLDYSSELADAWGNYAYNVATLLVQDATSLYNEWNTSYATGFKSHNISVTGFSSAEACVEQIIDGCIDIANEVGTAKIGEPVDYWNAGQTTKALYAVESWYSWHSRDDYKNNILSIANSVLGQRFSQDPSTIQYRAMIQAGTLTENSLIVKCMKSNELRQPSIVVWQNICAAWTAIDEIPQPFRNNIGSDEAAAAMDACAALVESLEALKGKIADNLTEDDCQEIVDQFVDYVVLPTYTDLVTYNKALQTAVAAFKASPSNSTFTAAAAAWLTARAPWESSEAFLFGPVADMGLDPNMDSWPLDAVGIANLLQSQAWSDMEWSGNYDEDDEAIEAAQSVRGYHTLEFLLFKDGKARTVK